MGAVVIFDRSGLDHLPCPRNTPISHAASYTVKSVPCKVQSIHKTSLIVPPLNCVHAFIWHMSVFLDECFDRIQNDSPGKGWTEIIKALHSPAMYGQSRKIKLSLKTCALCLFSLLSTLRSALQLFRNQRRACAVPGASTSIHLK